MSIKHIQVMDNSAYQDLINHFVAINDLRFDFTKLGPILVTASILAAKGQPASDVGNYVSSKLFNLIPGINTSNLESVTMLMSTSVGKLTPVIGLTPQLLQAGVSVVSASSVGNVLNICFDIEEPLEIYGYS